MTPADKVMAILGSDPVFKMKPFSFEGAFYDPGVYLWVVSMCIYGGTIQVKEKSGMQGAKYLWEKDTIVVPPITSEPTIQALVVHEAVHAWQDFVRIEAPAEDIEGPAYIIQMMYLSQLLPSGTRLTSDIDARDYVFEQAWNLAKMIMRDGAPARRDYAELQEAINSAPEYLDYGLGVQKFDGVPWPATFP